VEVQVTSQTATAKPIRQEFKVKTLISASVPTP
jgi:hypothetical protein